MNIRTLLLVCVISLGVSACQTPAPPQGQSVTQPPVAKKIPHITTLHGDRLVDNYYWLRKRNSPAVLAYLKAEDAYTDWFMKSTGPLQEALYKEMIARVQETDTSVPYRDGDYFYYHRTEEGKQYPVYCRKRGSTNAVEEVTLDLNRLGEGQEFIELGVYEVSDDGNLLAYSLDTTGLEVFTLYIKNLQTGELLAERIPRVDSVAWAADNKTLFYVTEDAAKRAYRLWRHALGATSDTLLYEEKDALFTLGLGRSRSKEYVFVESASKTSSEVRYLRADEPTSAFKLIAPRTKDHEYDVDHSGDLFYIRTNDKGRNFRLVTAPVTNPGRENWKEIVPCRDDVVLDDVELFAKQFVLLERENGLPRLRVVDIGTGESHVIEVPEVDCALDVEDNAEFNSTMFRYGFESLRTPHTIYDYDVTTLTSTLLKQRPVKGYNPDDYQVERLFATASDGTRIPISLVYCKGIQRDGSNPLLLDGYGAYGIPNDVWFSSNRISLLDRGVVYASAHVRGGGEFGRKWYDAGRLRNKRNTFTDFIACARFLIREGYTSKDHLAITGASAGGLTMGAVLNMRPDLFKVALVEVPFVDIVNTMLDESLPLTVGEFEEWGNPKNKADYEYMKGYSPYDKITPTNYPAMLVKSSLNDSRVMYWEPAKYVAKLRATKTDHNPLLFRIDLEPAGHNGRSGRYDALRELAFDYAFILTQLGISL
ncbi:MAG TPA: S9 family peptidase [Verrucomicrobiae bacterium]|nr:S9 family peptidase [Verrucomicrobiae bacterium]